VARLATFLWHTPPPTSIDEELALYDDGVARLVVRKGQRGGPSVGTYATTPDKAAFNELAAAGPGPVQFDLLHTPAPAVAALMARAKEVADAAIERPEAVALFYARRLPGAEEGQLSLALGVVGQGEHAVQVDLDPRACAVHFSDNGQEVAWLEMPPPVLGFVTPEADLLGGVNMRAGVEPGIWATINVDVDLPAEPATAAAIQVGGWLYEALPDEARPGRFDVRTDDVDLRLLA
jgi:hypothetical protein